MKKNILLIILSLLPYYSFAAELQVTVQGVVNTHLAAGHITDMNTNQGTLEIISTADGYDPHAPGSGNVKYLLSCKITENDTIGKLGLKLSELMSLIISDNGKGDKTSSEYRVLCLTDNSNALSFHNRNGSVIIQQPTELKHEYTHTPLVKKGENQHFQLGDQSGDMKDASTVQFFEKPAI